MTRTAIARMRTSSCVPSDTHPSDAGCCRRAHLRCARRLPCSALAAAAAVTRPRAGLALAESVSTRLTKHQPGPFRSLQDSDSECTCEPRGVERLSCEPHADDCAGYIRETRSSAPRAESDGSTMAIDPPTTCRSAERVSTDLRHARRPSFDGHRPRRVALAPGSSWPRRRASAGRTVRARPRRSASSDPVGSGLYCGPSLGLGYGASPVTGLRWGT